MVGLARETRGGAPATPWAQRRAAFHECRLYWASHPGIWLAAEDVVEEVRACSARIACRVLGLRLPPGGETAMLAQVVALGERLANHAGLASLILPPERLASARRAFDELTELARAGYDDRRAPGDSVVARLRAAGLTFAQARGVVGALLIVGVQTVTAAAPRIVALLADTGTAAGVRDAPARLAWALEEGLRYTVPSPVALRVTARDSVVAGHRFRAGTRVLLLTYNAVKSARYFPRPWRFDPDRRPDPRVRNLWYGAGVHFCLGFALAQEELRAILGAILAAPGRLRV